MTRRVSLQADPATDGPAPPAGAPLEADPAPATGAAPDPFDPAALRLTGDMTAALGVKKALRTVPVRKPDKTWFVRVHNDEKYHLTTAVIELKEDRETYLVAPALRPSLAAEPTFSPRVLFTAVNRQGVPFLWSVRIAGPHEKVDPWSRSALEAANLARDGWVRVTANMGLGAYNVYQATGDLPEPEFPDAPLSELLKTAFKDRFIDTADHPVLRKLRGEV